MILLYYFLSPVPSAFIEGGDLPIEASLISWSCLFLKGQLGLLCMIVEIYEDLRQRFLAVFDDAALHDVVALSLFGVSIDAALESALIHPNDINLFKSILTNIGVATI